MLSIRRKHPLSGRFCCFGLFILGLLFAPTAFAQNYALYFDGDGDYVDMGDLNPTEWTNAPEDITMEVWFKATAFPNGTARIAGVENLGPPNIEHFQFRLNGNQLEMVVGFESSKYGVQVLTATTPIQLNQWYHVWGTYFEYDPFFGSGNNVITLYVNGEQVVFRNLTSQGYAAPWTGGNFRVGDGFTGYIDELRIWTNDLHDERYYLPFSRNVLPPLSGTAVLKHEWTFNDGSGTTVTGRAGDNPFRNGTLVTTNNPNPWVLSDAPTRPTGEGSLAINGSGAGALGTSNVTATVSNGNGLGDVMGYRMDFSPTNVLTGVEEIYNDQFWVIAKRAPGFTFETDLQFQVAEPLGSYAANLFKLYHRTSSASGVGAWTELATSTAVDANQRTLLFDNLTLFQGGTTHNAEFLVARQAASSTTPSAVAGTALDFDGTDDVVDLRTLSLSGSALTLQAWVQPDAVNNQRTVVSVGSGTGLHIENGKAVYSVNIGGTSQSVTGSVDLTPGTWYHLAGTFDGTTLRVYVDGIEDGSQAAAGSYALLENGYIGAGSGVTSAFDGRVDEVAIWTVARSANEIVGSFQSPLAGSESGLAYYFQFAEGSGSITTDTQTQRFGTLINMNTGTVWVPSSIPVYTATVATQTPATGDTAPAVFGATGVTMDFSANTQANTIAVARFATAPPGLTTILEEVFDAQYWVVRRAAGGTFATDLTFAVNGGVGSYTANLFKLYRRSADGTGTWTEVSSASSVNAGQQTVTFSGITEFGQFFVARDVAAGMTPSTVAGTALDFNGTNGEVNLQSTYIAGNALSVEAWVRPDAFSGDQTIVSVGSDLDLRFTNGQAVFALEIGGAVQTVTGSTTLLAERWHHVAGTYDGTTLSVIVNGESDGTLNASGTVAALGTFRLGAGAGFYDGLLDEVRLWTGTRSLAQVRQTMHATLAGNETDLRYYFQFHEGSGASATDRVSGRVGALQNINTTTGWVTSTVTVPSALAVTETPTTGSQAFGATGLRLGVSVNPVSEPFIVDRFTAALETIPTGIDEIYNDQYWSLRRLGTGTFTADLALTPSEPIGSYAANLFELFRLQANGAWVSMGTGASVSGNEVTFSGITTGGTFVLTRRAAPSTSPQTSLAGAMLNFDGTDDVVDLRTVDISGTNLSVEAIVRAGSVTTGTIVSIENGSLLSLDLSGGNIRFGLVINGTFQQVTGSTAVTAGIHQHMAGTFDGSTLRVFLDGQEVGSAATSGSFNLLGTMQLGNGASAYQGRLDEVRIWTASRTASDLASTRFSALAGNESGLLYYFQFNEGSGTTTTDTQRGRFGTLTNMDTGTAWESSTWPLASASSTQTETPGTVTFGATGVSGQYLSQSGASVTVRRISAPPVPLPTGVDEVLQNQYWMFERTGSGLFNVSLTFTTSEDLTAADAAVPARLKLFRRDREQDAWALEAVGARVDANANTVTFDNIRRFSHYAIARGDVITASTVSATDDSFEDRVLLTWTAPSAGAGFIQVTRQEGANAPVVLSLLGGDATSYIDATGNPGVSYTYCINLQDNAGITIDSACDTGRRIIFAPTSMIASGGVFEDKVQATWSDRSNIETGYNIYRDGTLLGSVAANVGTYDDATAVSGTSYNYCVTAYVDTNSNNAFDNGTDFESAQVCDNGQRGHVLPPLNLTATDGTYPDKVILTWTDQTEGETGYQITRTFNNNTQTIQANTGVIASGETTFEDLTAVSGQLYRYCVTTLSAGGNSVDVCDFGGIGVLPTASAVTASDDTFDDKVRVSWADTSTTETAFRIYRENLSTNTTILVDTTVANRTRFEDTTAEPNVSYRYCVEAITRVSGSVVTAAQQCDNGRRIYALAPTHVAATDSTHEDRVIVSWTTAATTAALMKIYRDGTLAKTVQASVTSWTDTEVASDQSYNYCVEAVTAQGNASSQTCNTGSRRLEPPTDVAATNNTDESTITVTWVDNSGVETGYQVYRKVSGASDSTLVSAVSASAAEFVDRTAASGVGYMYSVVAVDQFGASISDSDTGERTLTPPLSVEATDGTYEDQVVITWLDESKAETGYRVYRRLSAETDSTLITTTAARATSYTDNTNLTFGADYVYSVFAVDASGISTGLQDPGKTAVNTPETVRATDTYTDKVVITWVDKSVIETGYRVYRDGAQVGGDLVANATAYVDNSATSGVQATYCVEAINGSFASTQGCDSGLRANAAVAVVPEGTSITETLPRVTTSGYTTRHASISRDGLYAIAVSDDDNSSNESVRIFSRVDGSWTLQGSFSFPSGEAHFVAISKYGEYASATSPSTDRVYIFERQGATWTLQANPISVAGSGDMRAALNADGSRIAIADGGSNLYVYRRTGTSWNQEAQINHGGFGVYGVDIDNAGETVITGTGGFVRLYRRTGTSWNEEVGITDTAFGGDVKMDPDGNQVIVAENGGGSLSVYQRIDGAWHIMQHIPRPDGAAGSFGASVDIAAGHLTATDFGNQRMYVYQLNDGWWSLASTLRAGVGVISGFALSLEMGTESIVVQALENGVRSLYAYDLIAAPGNVQATDGSQESSVQVSWNDLGDNEENFKVYRDGALIATTGANIRSYTDSDIPAGHLAYYCVSAFNENFEPEETGKICDWGYRPPDGFIGGSITSRSGGGIPDVDVCLAPSPNQALLLDGNGGYVGVKDAAALDFGTAQDFTLETWVKYGTSTTTDASIVEKWTVSGNAPFGPAYPYALRTGSTQAGAVVCSRADDTNTVSVTSTRTDLNDDTWHHIACVHDGTAKSLTLYIDGVAAGGTTYSTLNATENNSSLFFGWRGLGPNWFGGAIDEVRLWNATRSVQTISSERTAALKGTETDLVGYWSFDELEGGAVTDVVAANHGFLVDGAFRTKEAAPISMCAQTNTSGNYTLSGIRYGESTTFTLTPEKTNRTFDPVESDITLSVENPVQNEVRFNDVSSYGLAGRILYNGTECPVEGVQLYVGAPGEAGERRGETESDGAFVVAADLGNRVVRPALGEGADARSFSPESRTFDVSADLFNISYADLTTRKLTGFAGGDCQLNVGQIKARVFTANGCYDQEVTLNGAYSLTLPPQEYFVQVVDVEPVSGINKADVVAFFDRLGVQSVDLTGADAELDLIYRAPVSIAFNGITTTDATCSAADQLNVPVLAQGATLPITIGVTQNYGSAGVCPIDEASVRVVDVISNKVETVTAQNGGAPYTINVGAPNILNGLVIEGVDRSYQKSIEATVEVDGLDAVTETQWVVVEGLRARIGTFTSAVTDPIPMLVLHDPPGNSSYAYLEEGTSVCHTIDRAAMFDLGLGTHLELELGINTTLGFGFGGFVATTFGGALSFEGRTVLGSETSTLNECVANDNVGDTIGSSLGAVAALGPLAIPFVAGNIVFATQQDDMCGPSFEVCVTAEQTITTGLDEIMIGPDADVIVGTALNFLFALADKVDVTEEGGACTVNVEETLAMDLDPDGAFETTFIYPQFHIKNVLLNQQTQLIELTENEESKAILQGSLDNLNQILSDNARVIKEAIEEEDDTDVNRKRENRSFAAGAPYEYSIEHDSTRVTYMQSTRLYLNSENNVGAKLKIAGNDQKIHLAFDINREFSVDEERSTTKTTTVGYVIDDDDIGDYFTTEIGWDPVYGTPVFDLVSGATSNPWNHWLPLECFGQDGWDQSGNAITAPGTWNEDCEPRSQPHDRPTVGITPSTRINVAPDELATFNLALGNTSDAGSSREYRLRALNEYNPDGAIMRVNGTPLHEELVYFIPSGESQNATMTVERGPSKYQYDSLAVVIYPPFEYEVWTFGGLNGNGIIQMADTVFFNVSYNAPCSDISVLRPLEFWRYTGADTNPLEVILNDFSLTFGDGQDVQAVGLEYRRAGESTWLEAFRQAASGLSAGTTSLTNQTWTPPQDGTYELRGFTECQGTGKLYSTPVVGSVDTAPPVVFTTPQPADQVLTLGEDVALTFDEPVLCSTVDTDGANNNDTVQLFYADGVEDGQVIPITAACNEHTITFAPQMGWTSSFEGRLIRARVNGITDPSGNALASAREWTFTVARNTIAFNPANKHVVLSYGQGQTVAVELVNGSSEQASFSIPANLTLQQTHDGDGQAINSGPTTDIATRDAAGTALSTGSMVANGAQGITFTLPNNLALGRYAGSFNVTTTPDLGPVPFHFTTQVVCQAPTWAVNPADFQYSMTVTAQLFLNDGGNYVASTDTQDQIAAFVDGEVRGVASVRDLGGGLFRANLIVYSNEGAGEKVEFRVYDSSTCNLHEETSKVFIFQSDVIHGTPNQPISVQAPAPPAQNIAMAAGWTWISTNKVPASNDVTNVLKTLGGVEGTAGDIIKSQTAFSLYDAGSETWIGTLTSIEPGVAYQIKLAQSGEFQLQGPDANINTAITLQQGWNWVGYTPQAAQSIDAALTNLSTAQTNDLIKSQFGFAQYVDGIGWLGSLMQLEPGYGYLLRTAQAGSFAYGSPPPEPASLPVTRMVTEDELHTQQPQGDVWDDEKMADASRRTKYIPGADEEDVDVGGLDEDPLRLTARTYAHSMAVVVAVSDDLLPMAGEQLAIGAYVGNELRGQGHLVYIEALEAYRAFVLVHSDGQEHETITFKRLDIASGKAMEMAQEVAFSVDGVAGAVEEPLMLRSASVAATELPTTFALEANYPNPFNPTTMIRYAVPEASDVELAIYDVMGRHVITLVEGEQQAGRYEVVFDGQALASGVYIYRMRAGSFVQARRMILVK